MELKNAFLVGGARTPFVKSMTHFAEVTRQDLMVTALRGLVHRFNLQNEILGDVALGALLNSASQWNLSRECLQSAGLSPYTPGYNVQRACGTSLDTSMQIAAKIQLGQIDWGIAGGVDTNSDVPIEFSDQFSKILVQFQSAKSIQEKIETLAKLRLPDLAPKAPAVREPRTGMSMGEHCEKMVQEWKISREEQDALAFESHQKATHAYEQNFLDDLLVETVGLKRDTLVRPDTTLEKLANLKPAFAPPPIGTLTAGNSSALSDGASAVLLASEAKAKERNLPLLARFVDAQVSAVDYVKGDGLLMAPTVAVGKLLERNNLKLEDFNYYEIHEAFAGQVLCTLKAWESNEYCKKFLGLDHALGSIDRKRMNIMGGSVALGHPFAATGARIMATLGKILSEHKGQGRGLISICTAGGMGVAAILETV